MVLPALNLGSLFQMKHQDSMEVARERLTDEYGMGDDPDVMFSRADQLYAGLRFAECFRLTTKYVTSAFATRHLLLTLPHAAGSLRSTRPIDRHSRSTSPACITSRTSAQGSSFSRTSSSTTNQTTRSAGTRSGCGTFLVGGGRSPVGTSGPSPSRAFYPSLLPGPDARVCRVAQQVRPD